MCALQWLILQLLSVQVQEDVRPACIYNEDTGFFGLPSPEDLAAKHIVVCTCTAAGRAKLPALSRFMSQVCSMSSMKLKWIYFYTTVTLLFATLANRR